MIDTPAPDIDPASSLGIALRVFAVLSAPQLVYGVLLLLAVVWYRRRLRRLAGVVAFGCLVAAGAHLAIRYFVGRPRPRSRFVDTVTYESFAFPSGHATAAGAAFVLALGAAWVFHVRLWPVAVPGVVLVLLVLANRWAMNAHWVTDLIAGVGLGSLIAGLSVRWLRRVERAEALVIYHPGKIARHTLARLLPGAVLQATTADGSAQIGCVSKVLVAGGDGTIRAVAAKLVGSQTALGALPLGTGNLLAGNLGRPKDLVDAARHALAAEPEAIDVLWVQADDRARQLCLTMAGAGADAAVLADTSQGLKAVFRAGAYLLAGLRNLRPRGFAGDVAQVCVGNVGALSRGLVVLPEADPRDGKLDVLEASPATTSQVWSVILAVLRGKDHPLIRRWQADSLDLVFDRPVGIQIDGEVIDPASRLRAGVSARSLLVL